jgi:hypothetical protein
MVSAFEPPETPDRSGSVPLGQRSFPAGQRASAVPRPDQPRQRFAALTRSDSAPGRWRLARSTPRSECERPCFERLRSRALRRAGLVRHHRPCAERGDSCPVLRRQLPEPRALGSAPHRPSFLLHQPSSELGFPSYLLGTQSSELGVPSFLLGMPSSELSHPSSELHRPSTLLHRPSSELGFPSYLLGAQGSELHRPRSAQHRRRAKLARRDAALHGQGS